MSARDNTAYIKESSVARIEKALDTLLGGEGYVRVPKPPPRKPAKDDPMLGRGGAASPLWALALIPGGEWTAIKTAPLELLCEPAAGKLRLGALAAALGAPAFQLNLYENDGLLLLEAAPSGEVAVSGSDGRATGDPPAFRLIEVPPAVADVVKAGQAIAAAFSTQSQLVFGFAWDGDESSAIDNNIQTNLLVPHEECAEGTAIYYRRKGR